MFIKRKLFPKGTKLGDNDDSVPWSSGSSTFNADPDLFLPANPADPASQLLHYKFLFWNVFGTLTTNSKEVSGTPSGTNKDATAWYGLVGGGDGKGGEGIITYAFSPEQDTVVDDTPIASVKPTEAWKSGNTVSPSAGDGSRAITALDSVPHLLSSVFKNWFPLGPGAPEKNDSHTLDVDHGVSTSALALYKSHVDVVRGGTPPSTNPDKTTKPGPISIDRTKLIDILAQAQTHPASDRLTQVLKKEQTPVMADDLRGVAVELKANIKRLQAAIDLINAKLEGKATP